MAQMKMIAAATLGLGLAFGTWQAAAQTAPKTVAEIANYTGADRQKILEDGARREGALMIYSTGTQADPVYQAFGKKYPFVKVEAYKADSTSVTRRMIEEYASGRYIPDAIDLSVAGLRAMHENGLLQSYKTPEHAAYPKTAIEPGGHWTLDYESYVGLGYNTKLISEAEVPKTYDDLLDPKWRGKMAVPGTSTLANWIGEMLADRDEAFVRKLSTQQIRVFEVSARAVANLVVSGEVAMSPAMFNSHFANSRDQGAPVAWRALGGVYATTGAMALPAKAPHPHAAMLFIDFVLSQEGQSAYGKLGYASARTDMAAKDKPSKVYYFGDAPDFEQNYEKWMALGRQVVGK